MAGRRIIVTGFEPFGGASVNTSWEAVRTLDRVEKALLPVSFARAGEAIRRIAASAPDAVVCVGEAGGRLALRKTKFEKVTVALVWEK